MNRLRKALDKAKKAREQCSGAPTREPVAYYAKSDGPGCVSPVYCESQSHILRPEVVAENRCVCIMPDAAEIECYKVLRTRILQRTRDNGSNTLMITSAMPGEGKTLTAINLALVFAREFNQTVLLVDSDLRQQKVHRYLGLPNGAGLADYLIDDKPLKDLIVWPEVERLTVISGGRTIRDSAELIGSPKMKNLVAEMKSRYDDRYVFFDVPPLLGGADALTFAPLVSAILMVVQAGRTAIQDVQKALDLLPKDKFLGFVLNRQRKNTEMPGYGKAYALR